MKTHFIYARLRQKFKEKWGCFSSGFHYFIYRFYNFNVAKTCYTFSVLSLVDLAILTNLHFYFAGTDQENNNIEVPDGVMGIEIGPTEQVGEKPSPEFETEYNQQLVQEEQLSWSRVSTLLMLSEYAKRQSLIDEGRLRKKKAIEEISTIMSQNQFIFTGEQCATRLKTLVRGYKQVKAHNNKSGNQKKTYVYEKELDDIMGDKPNVKPACTVSSNQDEQHEGDDEMPVDEQRGRKRSQDDQGKNSQPKVRKTQISEVLAFMKEQSMAAEKRRAEEQERKDSRHKERIELMKNFIDILKK